MEIKEEIKQKNTLGRRHREKRSDIEDEIVKRLEERGYNVVRADAVSSLVEFDVMFDKTLIDRGMLHNLDSVFDGFEYNSVNAEEDDSGSPVLRVSFTENLGD